MNISAEEKIMYRVMKALYDSGIPVSFKGSMVLKACLMEAGFSADTRHTVDIDGNWYSETTPTADQMVGSFQNALDQNDIPLDVSIYRMYAEKRSAGFELKDRCTGIRILKFASCKEYALFDRIGEKMLCRRQ